MFNKYELGEFTEDQVLELTRKAYRNGVADFIVESNRCALLVIDMQDEFVKPHWTPDWVPDATRKVPQIKRLIQHCRSHNIPVIYTVYSKTHNYLDRPKTGVNMPGRFPEVDVDSTKYYIKGKVWHELEPKEEEIIIHKSSYGAFYDTPLQTILTNMGKDTIIVTGVIANYCCSMTARQGYERSFKVVFGSDLTGIDYPDLLEYELMVLRKGFAKVLNCDEIIRVLS